MFLYQQRYEEQDDGLPAPATLAQVLQRPFMQIEVYTAAVQFQIGCLHPLCEQDFVSTFSLIRSRGGTYIDLVQIAKRVYTVQNQKVMPFKQALIGAVPN